MYETNKNDYTLGEWLDIWLREIAPATRRETTMEIYRDARRRLFRHHPEAADILLSELTTLQTENWLISMQEQYSKSTLRHIRIVLNQSYKSARKGNNCKDNPIRDVTLPNAHEKIVTAMTQEEQNAFMKSLSILQMVDDYALRIFLQTGLRNGELRYLRWEDWDPIQKTILIRQSKTINGVRRVPLTPEVTTMLHILYTQSSHRPGDCIITLHDGEPVCKTHFRTLCNKVTNAAGIRHITPHVLRHTFATRLIEKGADPKSVSMLLGHKNVAFTLQKYVSPDLDHLKFEIMRLSDM